MPLHVRTWDGATWSEGIDAARGSAPAFVFVHGLGEGGYVFDLVVPDLACPGPCIVPDLKGHGESDWNDDGRYSVARHAADIGALCRGLGRRPLVLIGHSLGAAVALHVAARGQFDIAGLALIDFGPEVEIEGLRFILGAARDEERVYQQASDYRAHLAATRPWTDAATLDCYASRALRRRADGRHILKRDDRMIAAWQAALGSDAAAAAAATHTLWSAFGALECPTLVIRGAASAVLSPSVAQTMARRAWDGSLRTVSHAGHAVMADNPTGFIEALRPFLLALS